MTYNMTIEQIKSLLARFYEGQTTPEEERLLADFFTHKGYDHSVDFRRENVPEDLQEDKQLFLLLAQTSDQEMPQDIAEEITAFVNNLGQTKIQPLIPEDKQRKGVIFRLKTPPKMWYRVAATVAILLAIGGGMFVHQQRTLATDPFRDTCSTPEEAADAIFYANDIINRSTAPFLRSTMIATEQVNDINETLGKIQPYINQ
ncbi:MAG: hypothetical protein II825_00625 [Paludibacteraceae bacterium]|nr:hypothetical protein [Paludibacteraceae bacterium]